MFVWHLPLLCEATQNTVKEKHSQMIKTFGKWFSSRDYIPGMLNHFPFSIWQLPLLYVSPLIHSLEYKVWLCENLYKWRHCKLDEPLSQRNCLACLISQTFGMFKLDKIIFGLSQTNIVFQTTVGKATREAGVPTTRTEN